MTVFGVLLMTICSSEFLQINRKFAIQQQQQQQFCNENCSIWMTILQTFARDVLRGERERNRNSKKNSHKYTRIVYNGMKEKMKFMALSLAPDINIPFYLHVSDRMCLAHMRIFYYGTYHFIAYHYTYTHTIRKNMSIDDGKERESERVSERCEWTEKDKEKHPGRSILK